MNNIVIQKITRVNNQGNLRAFVDVTVGGTTWHRCRIIQEPGRQAWFSLPQITYPHRITGEVIYMPALTVPKVDKDYVGRIVLAAWEEQEGVANA